MLNIIVVNRLAEGRAVTMKNKWYKQTWLWLMLIFCTLVAPHIYKLFSYLCPRASFLYSGSFWTAVGSIGTLISVIVAVTSTVRANSRKKKEKTLDAYTKFKEAVSPIENLIHNYTKDDIDRIITQHKRGWNSRDWNMIKDYLTAVERIAVGVNTEIYDIDVINRMGGYFMYEQYLTLKPIISYKRYEDTNPYIYREFTNMVNKIIDARVKNEQPKLNYVE